jgi:isoleucyl-tRNA synthetase
MPFSTGCSTPLSNFEAGQNYKDVQDPAVFVSFPVDDDPDGAAFVAWTTTPWTLPSNLALCVNPEFDYVKAKDPATGKVYIVAETRLSEIPGAVPKAKKGGGGGGGKKKDKKGGSGDKQQADASAAPEPTKSEEGFSIIAKMKGSDLVGKTYQPLFPYFADMKATGAFKVCGDAYVTSDSGTGVVHQAPAFGEDDFRVCLAHGVIARGDAVPCPVDDAGCFIDPVSDFKGHYVKVADKEIIAAVKAAGRMVHVTTLTHSYPFCWRSDTPLIYKAVPSWFVRVEQIKSRLLETNTQTNWVPSYVKEKRFHNWLESARDWAISRSRFWGTPIPIWASEDGEELVVVGSREELEELTGSHVEDLHRHFIDDLTIPSRRGKGVLRRVDDVFDCWFESGSMPYAQLHYPFENRQLFEDNFPADFVAEGLDQTRGWFYTLMVLSTALFDRPAFKNLICNGLVLASDGKKMSKRLKNYPDPMEVVGKYGADALRLYLINSPVVRAETLRFKEDGVLGVVREVFLPWYNAYRFAVQNVLRWQVEAGKTLDMAALPGADGVAQPSNVLDRWILAATRSLTRSVREEMGGYRLYTVVPALVGFIEGLTNTYVRLNRRRLKGRGGPEDAAAALGTLFHVLLTLCKTMSPFTPFFTEMMYQNLRRALPGEPPASVHWCDFPTNDGELAGDAQLEASVGRMQRVIELVRQLRERHGRPVKAPLRKLVVVHPDAAFLHDITCELREYVASEANVREIVPCDDQLQYATLRAEPVWAVLGGRLGKRMGAVGAAIKALPQAEVMRLAAGETLEVAEEEISPEDIKILRDFKPPEGTAEGALDAAGDGEVLVVIDLTEDEGLKAAGTAREVVNRVQKLRKKAALGVTEAIDVFLAPTVGGDDLWAAIEAESAYVLEAVGTPLQRVEAAPTDGELLIAEEACVPLGGDVEARFEVRIFMAAAREGTNGVGRRLAGASLEDDEEDEGDAVL